MKAAPIFQALEALRVVQDDMGKTVPLAIWSQCMRAFIRLEGAIACEPGLRLQVEKTEEAAPPTQN